jgi:hypothetical protein
MLDEAVLEHRLVTLEQAVTELQHKISSPSSSENSENAPNLKH